MIVYKNYYPDSFAQLPKRKGEIYNALCREKKIEYQTIAVDKVLKKRKEELQQQCEALFHTQYLSAKELRKIYVWGYLRQ